ncbi:hypothetical protein MC885_016810 [Smutsia gigantea]|nr:hypothetical protein MC885_016810 [Smutsia gigantea]
MGPGDRDKCYGPQLGFSAAGNGPMQGHCGPHSLCGHIGGQGASSDLPQGGWDHMDGQILGQLRPLAEEEPEEGAAPPARPAFPGMGSEELRLASFYDWPPTAMVQPELLAAAGFFHTGRQDKVRCFFCCGGLQSWERGDDPWAEHAKWFPRCEFLLQTKGREFVCSVQESRCHLLDSWDQSEEPEEAATATPSGEPRRMARTQLPQAPAACSVAGAVGVPPLDNGEVKATWPGVRCGTGLLPGGSLCVWKAAGPELPTASRQTQLEGAWKPGAQDAEEQLQHLREEQTCKVCLDQAVRVVFVPCGHMVCTECAPALQLCPICRSPIRSCVRTFLS